MRGIRRLQVTSAGYWYLSLTVGIGVVALGSGNNTIYLVESLLLSGLILSGVLAERSISGVRVEVRRGQAVAGARAPDAVYARNVTRRPVFGLEVAEWRGGRFHPLAFFARIDPGETARAASRQVFDRRGEHAWDSLALGTSFPFGFARKIKLFQGPGERLIWPASASDRARARGRGAGGDCAEGEVRPFREGDDVRRVVWTLSGRNRGIFVRAPAAVAERETDVALDLRQASGEGFERAVEAAAGPVFRGPETSRLTLRASAGARRIRGRRRALDELARARAEGAAGSDHG